MFRIIALIIVLLCSACSRSETYKTDCSLDKAACTKTSADNITVSLDAAPKPPHTMANHRFFVELKKDGAPMADAEVTLDFTMPGMYMGINRLKMNNAGKGRYGAEWVIPPCPAGKKVWIAAVYIERQGGISQTEFSFEVR